MRSKKKHQVTNFFNKIFVKKSKVVDNSLSYSDKYFTNVSPNFIKPTIPNITPQLNKLGYYDILLLYYSVIDHMNTYNKTLDNGDIEKLEWIAEKDPDPTERRLAKEKLFEISQNVIDPVEQFRTQSKSILSKYVEICNTVTNVDFWNRKNISIPLSIKNNTTIIAQDFISLCQGYVPIVLNYKEIKNVQNSEDDESEVVKTLDIYGNTQKYNRQKYHNVKHFQTCIRKVQGIHRKEIPSSIFDEIREYCSRNMLKNFTIFDLDNLLKLNKNLSKYYKDIHLIYRLYTGIQTINLSDIEDRLIDMYIEQDNISHIIKLKENSKNSINATYICCRIAQFLGRKDLRMVDFFCTKSSKTILKYDEVMKKRAQYLGWINEFTDFDKICK